MTKETYPSRVSQNQSSVYFKSPTGTALDLQSNPRDTIDIFNPVNSHHCEFSLFSVNSSASHV